MLVDRTENVVYYEKMEKEPTLTEMIFGSTRAAKMQEVAHRIRNSDKPVTLLDVENWVVETLTGVPKRDDLIDGQ